MTILLFFVILVALVLVHEFGHFIVAKRAGIRVDEFGVGFPPRLFGVRRGETLYSFNALPFGGFVRIFGENPDEESLRGPDASRSFVRKSKFTQALVLVAGVAMNLLFAWGLFSAGFLAGMPTAVTPEDRESVENPKVLITRVLPHSAAEAAGFETGDEIRRLTATGDEIEIESPVEVSEFVDRHPSESLSLTVLRDGREIELSAMPATIEGVEEDRAILGIITELVGIQKLPLHLALTEGAKLTGVSVWAVITGVWDLIAGAATLSADLSQITGPVGIVSLVGDASSLGLIYLLTFTAFVSINLAIINLLPFPALDGGRLLFVGIEAIKGTPIRPAIANLANTIGFALLILLMLLVTYNDIVRLIG